MLLPQRILSLAVLLAAGLGVAAGAQDPSLPRPEWPKDPRLGPRGTAADVRLLATVATEEDPRVREAAVADLGNTRRSEALPAIRKALHDADVKVRCAAVRAAAELGNEDGWELVRQALGDEDAVALAAMAAIRRHHRTDVAPDVAGLVGERNRAVKLAAVQTLTLLGRPAPVDALRRMLSDGDLAARVHAVQNARLLPAADLEALSGRLLDLAMSGEEPALRAGAVTALGKLPFTDVPDSRHEAALLGADAAKKRGVLVDRAVTDPHPLLRRAALRALAHGVEAGHVRRNDLVQTLNDFAFHEEKSGLVRLAGIRICGQLQLRECTEAVFGIMQATAYDDWDVPGRDNRGAPAGDLHYESRLALIAVAESGPQGRATVAAVALPGLSRAVEALSDLPATDDVSAVAQKAGELRERLEQIEEEIRKARAKRRGRDAAASADRLRSLGQEREKAQRELAKATERLTDYRRRPRAERNIRACCLLLGHAQDAAAADDLLALLGEIEINSNIHIELCGALARIAAAHPATRDASVTALLRTLADNVKAGKRWARAVAAMAQPPPFSEYAAAAVAEALIDMRAHHAVDDIAALALVRAGEVRLTHAAAAVARRITPLAQTENAPAEFRQAAIELQIRLLSDRAQSTEARFYAARGLGDLDAVGDPVSQMLQEILANDRLRSPAALPLLKATAWALQKTTGHAATVPEVRPRSGNWVITEIRSPR